MENEMSKFAGKVEFATGNRFQLEDERDGEILN